MAVDSGAAFTAVQVDVEGGVATCTIDNGPINLFDQTLYTEMARLADQLATDDDVRVVVLRSANPEFFIAHFDVSLILAIPADPAAPSASPTQLNAFHRMCERFRTMPKATIAVIEGRVGGGGGELALSCDMRFADRDRALFNQPEVALGILPGGSGTVRLSRLVGRSRALEAILGCDDIDADTAQRWGWVNRSLDGDDLWQFVDRLAARIASFPTHAVRSAKAAVLRAEGDLNADLLAEGADFLACLPEQSARQAMERFLDSGGQTIEGERRLGDLAGSLGSDRSA
jgi:enoyl-CoA hydratase/carnithine racemase